MSWFVTRISTMQMNQFNRLNISRISQDLQTAGQEVASGRKADIYADLGARATSTLKLRNKDAQSQAYIASNGVLEHKLDAMLLSIDGVRAQAQSVLDLALANVSVPSNGAHVLQMQAAAAIESIVSALNTTYQGEHLFAGTASDQPPMTRWDVVNPDTGVSPEQLIAGLVAAPPADAASAQAMIDDIADVFNSANGSAAQNYEGTFFSGTPLLDGGGVPNARVVSHIGPGQTHPTGVQANDEPFREMLRGLAMLATTDVTQITDDAAYKAWMEEASVALSSGLTGALDVSAAVGFSQQVVETASERLSDMSIVQQRLIGEYENVDPYEAVTRMTNLETQLQASYEVSARLMRLSFMNHM